MKYSRSKGACVYKGSLLKTMFANFTNNPSDIVSSQYEVRVLRDGTSHRIINAPPPTPLPPPPHPHPHPPTHTLIPPPPQPHSSRGGPARGSEGGTGDAADAGIFPGVLGLGSGCIIGTPFCGGREILLRRRVVLGGG